MRGHIGEAFNGIADVEDVVSAYRLLLGRNPDEAGMRHFQALVERGLTVDQLCQAFVESVARALAD